MTRTRSGLARWMVVVLASAFAALEGCGGDEPTEAAPDGDGGSETSTPDSSMGMPDTGLGDSSSADTGIDAGDAGDAGLVFDNPKLAVGGGTVFTSLHAGRSWYLGGSFTRISPHGHINFIGINTAAGAARAAPLACPSPQSFNAAVRAIAKTATAIYVGGDFNTYKGASANRIAKLDPITCALDVTFSPVGANGFNGIVTALAVNATDLYVGGTFSGYRGVASSASNLAKLDATTGVLDTTFSPAGAAANGFDNTVNALALNATDLYVGGTFSAYKGAADSARRIAKLDRTTGVLDTTFSPPGATANGFNIEVSALVINATAVYAAGQFTEYKGVAASANRIAKLDLTTGALDTTFSPPGATTNGFDSIVHALALTGTDLYAGGGFTAYKGVASSANRIAKLNSTTGAIDTTFSPVGATANGFGSQVLALALSGNDLFVGGEFQSYRNAFGSANRFAKLNATTGVLDATFVPTGSNYGGVSGLAVRSALVTGTTLFLGGDFAVYAGTSVSKIAKLDDVTFTVDTTFSPAATNGFDNNSVVRALAASGTSIYAGGTFQAYRGVFFNANRIAKLDATTGALDTTFSPPGATANGFNQGVRALAANATDVYVGGDFSAYKGVASSARSIAKLNATTGAIDTTFSPVGATANGFDSAVYALAINATDVYAGGEFTAYRGAANSANRIAKLGLATGALDTTFSPAGATANGFNNGVRALAVNGTDVYVGGNFTAYQGVASSANRIAKLARTTGVIDATFSPAGATSNGFDGTVNSIALNATDVYVSGFVSAYKGVANSANGIAKLGLTSGAIDTVFSPVGPTANGVDDEVYTFTLGTSTCAVGCGTVLLLGGLYERYRDTPAGSLTILDPTTGAVK